MVYYVKTRLNGRKDYVRLAEFFNERGITNAEYFQGGWADQMVHNIASHIKFEDESDAIAYVLAVGGQVSKTIPMEDQKTSGVI